LHVLKAEDINAGERPWLLARGGRLPGLKFCLIIQDVVTAEICPMHQHRCNVLLSGLL